MQPKIWQLSAFSAIVGSMCVSANLNFAFAQATPTPVPTPTGWRLKDAVGTTELGTKNDTGPSNNKFTPWEPFAAVADRESNLFQVAAYPKWGLWPAQTTYNTTNMNTWIDWAKGKGKQVQVHVLVGPNAYEPDWLVNGTWTNQQLTDLMQGMVQGVITSNGNSTKVDYWNVVNEAFSGSDPAIGTYRTDAQCKWNQLGWETDASGLTGADKINVSHPIYIRKAFEFARGATWKKLELRENSMEMDTTSTRSKAFYQLTKHLINSGVPIDAVGFQCHLYGYSTAPSRWTAFKDNVRRYKALGMEVYIDELDIGPSTGGTYDANAERDCYYSMIKACREVGVDMICTWGLADDSSWRPAEKPLHFDANYNPKPAYYGMQSAIMDTRAFIIRAKGSAGGEKIELRIDNNVVADWNLSKNLTDYCWTGFSGYSGSHNIKVAFVNDGLLNGQDKNAQIDLISVNGITRQGESQANNTGNNSGSYLDWIYSNGYIDFGSISPSGT